LNVPGVEYSSPRTFTSKQRLTLALAPPLGALAIRALSSTLRNEVRHEDRFKKALDLNGHVIFAVWHECIAMGLWHYRGRGYHTMTSCSYDGELAAQTAQRFGVHAVRGSSSEGGGGALRELEKAIAHVEGIGITPDGPRGPRRVVQAGAVILAARTQTPLIPHAISATSAWRLRSWDRFMIPKPFATIVHAYGDPIPPPKDDSHEAVESTRVELENALNAIHRELETELDQHVFDD